MTLRRAFWLMVAGSWLYGVVEMWLWKRDQR